MKVARVLGVALGLTGVGCAGADAGAGSPPTSGILDCAWLASDNCIKATLMAAMSCTEPSTEVGVLNADRTTCTYRSGVVVTFDAPLLLPLGLNPPDWHFSVTRAGVECLRFDSSNNVNYTLVVNGNALTETGAPPPLNTLIVACPDGSRYSNSIGGDAGLLFCDPGGLPSTGFSSGESDGIFFMQLFPTDIVLTMFNCRIPP